MTDKATTTDAAETFERRESRVRSYSRNFPAMFGRAEGARLYDRDGREYIDFLAGCSTLNYGHNNPDMKKALIEYIESDGVTHGLDMFTEAKEAFLKEFETTVLEPRGLDYKVMFPGPTGANAVEAALKLARKVTGRTNVVAFTNGFHGMTIGALSCTGNAGKRGGAGMPLCNVSHLPYDGYLGDDVDTGDYIDRMIDGTSGGVDAPAAFIVETVQGEGGLNAASFEWLKRIEAAARRCGALFIVDDIQAGVGRTGKFFSFEDAGLTPDIVTLAKSISGYGLPLALTLFRPSLDVWKPGEHNGTFRGNNHAFVTARKALELFWRDGAFEAEIAEKGAHLKSRLEAMVERFGAPLKRVKGRGMMIGIDIGDGELAGAVIKEAFKNGLIIETSGAEDEILKVLCPLTITREELDRGLDILEAAVETVVKSSDRQAA